ncbi:uncharacterized protein K460DRAFT_119 [Cucurbitaria berberidis CBS 394.84]|uniref:Uncharacterized protein n=1 Tax=Cucurbitaria berberidis CBS 394.84 TaxID=1168544 RepID=A0A9P4GN90_9PLEO|nr:uncharacterized protein K460DRAFT_119 [Cucurbitaria berberidis CBS 394.84]KAF1849573.1 hypothetical protein K460DRAFT_119 [Cucurbitaria berberidis CBS 394.84]
MWRKFEGPSYTGFSSVDEAMHNCTTVDNKASTRAGCWTVLNCVLAAASPHQQAKFSAAATILGLLPTVLCLISISTDELLQIHCRFPILALLLSLSNPSTISTSLSSDPVNIRPLHAERSLGLKKLLSYSVRLPLGNQLSLTLLYHDVILHVLAAGCVALIASQTLVLGVRGVVVFACWTWHNPFTWWAAGGILHLLQALTWRLCLGPIKPSLVDPWTRWTSSIASCKSVLAVRRPRIARGLALFFQVTGLMNYVYGTVILSGMMLVNPYIALRTVAVIGLSGLLAKLIAMWLLTIFPDIESQYIETLESHEGQKRTSSEDCDTTRIMIVDGE